MNSIRKQFMKINLNQNVRKRSDEIDSSGIAHESNPYQNAICHSEIALMINDLQIMHSQTNEIKRYQEHFQAHCKRQLTDIKDLEKQLIISAARESESSRIGESVAENLHAIDISTNQILDLLISIQNEMQVQNKKLNQANDTNERLKQDVSNAKKNQATQDAELEAERGRVRELEQE
eukprot:751133-Hanusia_phi.AAC.9